MRMPEDRAARPAERRSTRPVWAVATVVVLVGVGIIVIALTRDAPQAAEGRPPAPTTTSSPTASPTAEIEVELELERIPWEGGPQYWASFAQASEWTDPSFFPIGIWHSGISSAEEVAWDTEHGINTYLGLWEGTDFSLFEEGGVYWIGGALNDTFDPASPHWPGVVLDDEVDGRFSPEEGLAHLEELSADAAGSGRFRYANFTQLVIGDDLDVDVQEKYVNAFTDAVSVDMYWYTIPFCDWRPYRGEAYAAPVPQEVCRTASSYGRTMDALTLRDAEDGLLQPRWQFIENLNGLSGHEHLGYISPEQLRGAAMSSIINEARGLVWFNQSFTGPCQSTNVIRTAQIEGDAWCGAPQVAAMGEVNRLIRDLAPVLNTQSYAWDFGDGLDTMLKIHDGHAYVFAMTDGTTGERRFTLPPEIQGTTAEAIGGTGDRPIEDGAFTDVFANERDYRIYRIAL
ncbi:hypothetical protein GCM10009803_12780 [Microbacterium ginsengiterrae]